MRALIAARLSKLQRGGQQGIGIDTQDEKSRAFCEREGMTVVGVVADTKSGTVAPWDRKNLKPWVTDPEKLAMYDAVVAYKTDRWSRGTQEDFTRIEFWATQHGKRLIIVDGPQYPAGGQVRFGLLAVAGGEDGRAPGMGTGPRAERHRELARSGRPGRQRILPPAQPAPAPLTTHIPGAVPGRPANGQRGALK